jgi:hypothetical protein
VPAFAQQHGFRYALTISSLQDVVVNAREQWAGVPMPDLIQAFSYYYDHDAFLIW